MKAVFILCALVVAVSARPGEQYTTKYDGINYQEVVSNERLLDGYFKCIMEQGPCTPSGKEFKSHIKDAMETKCEKCSDKQKEGAKYVIGYIIKHKPTLWKALCDKYDPERKYAKQYEAELKTVS